MFNLLNERKNMNCSILASPNRLRFLVIKLPAVENNLSAEVDVAGMVRSSNATFDKNGKLSSCSIHHLITLKFFISD